MAANSDVWCTSRSAKENGSPGSTKASPCTKTYQPRGMLVLKDPRLNKCLAFDLKERERLGIHGLLPPAIRSQNEQVSAMVENLGRCDNELDKYRYLMALLDRDEKLFFKVINDNIELTMPIIYTPTVGLACQKWGLIYGNPQGLYISINDAGKVSKVLGNWPELKIKVIVVTDGERILGLGDLGAHGMGIPVGKLCLYTACAGITPRHCLPITLDVGTNTESLLNDPLYIGLRQKRVVGKVYDAFIDEFMEAVVKRYGQNTMIQFEDFGNENAFRLLEKYRNRYCTFNDDIQGTAAVAVSGLMSSCKLTGKRLSDHKFLFQGAGEAALGIAELLVRAITLEGTSHDEAVNKVWLVDSKGLIVKDRPNGGITPLKVAYAHEHRPVDTLEEVVQLLKPTVIIGAAAIPGAFTETILRNMASWNDRPTIFALSNPTSKSECTAEQAYQFTDGKCIFASGSPYPPVTLNGKTFSPSQGNNAYIFPAVGLAASVCQAKHITEGVFLKAAQVLSDMVSDKERESGLVYPPLTAIREVSLKIAVILTEYLYAEKLATYSPQPADKTAFIRSQLYSTDYEHATV